MLYLTLRHYEYVCAVAQHGSLSAAAEAQNVSQPALSAALSKIEDHLGQTLFLRRKGAPLALTPQGRDFAKRAQHLIEQAAQLEAKGSGTLATQKLALGCFSDLAPFLLAPALRHLRATFPALSVTPRVGNFTELTEALLRGEVEFALTYDLGLDAGFSRQTIGHRQPHALMSPEHPLAGRLELFLRDLASEALILSLEGLSVQHMINLFKAQGLNPRVAHRAASLELLRSLAANGEGLGISYSTPPSGTSYDGKAVLAIPICDPVAREPVILASHGVPAPRSPQAAAQAALVDCFQNEGLAASQC